MFYLNEIQSLIKQADDLSQKEIVDFVKNSAEKRESIYVTQINLHNLKLASEDPDLALYIRSSDLVFFDGVGVRMFNIISGLKRLKYRNTGIDAMEKVLEALSPTSRIFLLGSNQQAVQDAEKSLRIKNPKLEFASHHGYFDEIDFMQIVQRIQAFQPNLVFVGMPTPKKEFWMYSTKSMIRCPQFGVGGAFDVISGQIKRAPKWMQIIGLEWSFRLLQEPRRLMKRYLFANTWALCATVVLRIEITFKRIKR